MLWGMQHQQTLPGVRTDTEHAPGVQKGKLRVEGATTGIRQPRRKGIPFLTKNRNLSAEIDRLNLIKETQSKDL